MSMSQRFTTVVVVVLGLLPPSLAVACLWDYDTIKMERARFPGALELITGKFLRHSPEFYRWRIENRLRRLETDPKNVALWDDLAVAYDKTGQHDKAIETALKTEALSPGRYETAANLGTFYFHAGRLEDGVPHIDRALRINPHAHFNREKYQKHLVEYVIQKHEGGQHNLPLATVKGEPVIARDPRTVGSVSVSHTFAEFLIPAGQDSRTIQAELPDALKAILGIMKFGSFDSPIVLEALGTLLAHDASAPMADAKLLAARAFLKASYEAPEGPAREAYRGMAARALSMQTKRGTSDETSLETIEGEFQKELAEARDWYANLRQRELSWIRSGANPETEFDKLYQTDPQVSGMEVKEPTPFNERVRRGMIVVAALCVVAILFVLTVLALIFRWVWRRRHAAQPSSVQGHRSFTPGR
jgi:tetratricopeptide (TPR) repeat protein